MDRTPGIRPRPTLWRRLDIASRYAAPFSTTALVLVVLAAPFGLPGQAQLQAGFALAAVFFWSLFRPAAMPPHAAFGLGLLLDLLSQGPVGVEALLLLLAHGIAMRSRRLLTRQGFATVWLAFTTLAATNALLEWGLVSLLTWRILPAEPGLFEFGVATGTYPLLAPILTHLHRGPAAPERA